MNTTVRGHFVCAITNQYNDFKAKDGSTIPGGSTTRVTVYDPESNTLNTMKVKGIDVSALTFGVRVTAECTVNAQDSRVVLTAVSLKADQPLAAAKAS